MGRKRSDLSKRSYFQMRVDQGFQMMLRDLSAYRGRSAAEVVRQLVEAEYAHFLEVQESVGFVSRAGEIDE